MKGAALFFEDFLVNDPMRCGDKQIELKTKSGASYRFNDALQQL